MNIVEQKRRKKFWLIVSILLLSMIGFLFISLSTGVISISPIEVIQTLMQNGTARQELDRKSVV